ncbi:MAG: tRNA 2-thiocytidine biosynthesis protein TtcA [Ruminococcaceae bacterium]|nr:tRNA 2-thiocytidine biosynthesis protein TtcA [Oscillospiraceae bacterium]
MIQDGDRVCVGLSGGKDSSAMLAVLAYLKRFYPKKFELEAVHISLGFANKEETREALQKYCDSLGVHFTFVESSIAEVVFDIRKESNPCALCANLRRGALNDHAARLGCNVVALAHHKDDVIETAMLSLSYEGRFYCFSPNTWLSRSRVSVIRPFIYVTEGEIKAFVREQGDAIPVVTNLCPMDKTSKRSQIKDTIKMLENDNHDIRRNIFGAVKRDVWARSNDGVRDISRESGQ